MTVKKMKIYPRMVADDNGYADHKLAWFDQNGKIITLKVPSIIQLGGQRLTDGSGKAIGAYSVGDVDFTCSTGVTNPLAVRTPDYPVSDANRVLATHALAKAGLLGMEVHLAVTLPFRDFFQEDGKINTKLRGDTADNFLKSNVHVHECEAQPNVVHCDVYAEAMSAFMDFAFTEQGDLSDGYNEMAEMNGRMLVVDIGGSTVDLACVQLIEGDMVISHSVSGTEKLGVLDAKGKLEQLIKSEMDSQGMLSGHESKIPAPVMNMIFENGQATWGGKRWDFTKERDQACNEIAQRIAQYVKSKAGSLNMYYGVLVAGGGAIVFEKMLKALVPNAMFTDEFANARGALKYLREKRQAMEA